MQKILKFFMILLLPHITSCMHRQSITMNEHTTKIGNITIQNKLINAEDNDCVSFAQSFIDTSSIHTDTIATLIISDINNGPDTIIDVPAMHSCSEAFFNVMDENNEIIRTILIYYITPLLTHDDFDNN